MIVDSNLYWVPEALFTDETLRQQFLAPISDESSVSGYYGYLQTNRSGQLEFAFEKPRGCQNLNYIQGEYLTEVQLRDMDAAGVDMAVLKTPCCQEWMDLDMCRIFNDGMAEQVRKSGGRLAALAVIPPFFTPETERELDRCLNDLGMHGVQLSAHYHGKYLDDPAFAPLFEALEARQLTAYVHHTPLPVQYDALLDYTSLRRSYGRCVDQTTAVCRELYSNMFEKYPHVKLVHSMLGGGFFAIAPMMMPHGASSGDKSGRFQNANGNVARQLQENIFFEMSHAQPWGKEQLECAVKVLGADHIVFGSSYPVKQEWLLGGPEFVRSLDISEEDKALILGGNARRLYHL
ncbi:MAG: amidohydrolase family protein [Oscillospiraceae bacterium]|nr:amidohydrolase family protein [Oscillospiraceae bacterium]